MTGLARPALVLVALVAAGCATSRALEPLGRGRGAVTASFGGPMFVNNGVPMPLPLGSVGYAHGVSDRTNVHGALYPTLVRGLYGAHVGAATALLAADGGRPGVMIDGTLYVFGGDAATGDPAGGVRLFPDVSAVAAWELAGGHHPYVGLDLFTQPFPSPRAWPSPMAGFELVADGRVGVQLEAQWIAPWRNTDDLVVDWVGPGKQGALSVQLGATVYLGRKEAP